MSRSELKQALLRGGIYLTIRQVLSLTLSLASVLIITRTLGPERYGWATVALSFIPFMTSLASIGLKIYLIRKPEECPVQLQGEILLFLIASSGLVAILTALTAPLVAQWMHTPELALILTSMTPAILLDTCAGVPLGMLERNLQYQRSSLAEIGSQLVYYIAAIPLVLVGWNVWAIVAAFLLRALFQVVAAFAFYPVHPVWIEDTKALRAALGYGLSYSISELVGDSYTFVITLLLGRFVGTQVVGLAGAANRMADAVAFARTIVLQLGISGFAKLQGNLLDMRRALNQGMIYQVFILIPVLGVFACLSPVLIPLVLGAKWSGVVTLFPFVGFAFIVRTIFDLHILVLYSIGHNLKVFRFQIATLFTVSVAIVLLGGRFGIWGYAAAITIGLVANALLHQSVSQIIGTPNYRPIFWAIACTLFPFFMGPYLNPLITIPMLVAGFAIACSISAELRTRGGEIVKLLVQKIRPT